jgi:hypothetical protein
MIPLDPGSNNVGMIHTVLGCETAMPAITDTWESTQDMALERLVIILEIIPDLYPPGSDDHGLPMEPTNQNILNVIPIEEEELVAQENPPETNSEGGGKEGSTTRGRSSGTAGTGYPSPQSPNSIGDL